jgi:peptidoglycan/xylan/chitin deacetylase (PgdA/CDA1 family)
VLAYHRIASATSPGFIGFAGNASADANEFSEQIGWAKDHFTPVTLTEVAGAVAGEGSLPRRPLLVTFDDGYRDNLTAALPVLQRHGVPAAVFLATDHIGSDLPFWWDRAARCLEAAEDQRVRLSVLGEVTLGADRRRLIRQWVQQAKQIPDDEMRAAVAALPGILGVFEEPGGFAGMTLDWNDVAAMSARGVEFGAHTCRHPVLTRVAASVAAAEVAGSVRRVAEAIGSVPLGFAYPNGQRRDVDDAIEAAVAASGVKLAFTLVPGPARWSEVVRRPLRIRRIYVHHGDGVDRFIAKVAGVPRFVGAWG